MQATQKPNYFLRLPAVLMVGALGLGIAGLAWAGGSEHAAPTQSHAATARTDKQSPGEAMDSRMAPTQNSTATGRNPEANSVPQEPAAKAKAGTHMQNKPGAGDKTGDTPDESALPRMAPTQNTEGTGEEQIDGS